LSVSFAFSRNARIWWNRVVPSFFANFTSSSGEDAGDAFFATALGFAFAFAFATAFTGFSGLTFANGSESATTLRLAPTRLVTAFLLPRLLFSLSESSENDENDSSDIGDSYTDE
jgi:hypothetical protein